MSSHGSHAAGTTSHSGAPVQDAEPTLGRLVADASRDVSSLVHSEIALAKAELKVNLTRGGVGAATLAVAAVIALLAVVLLSFAFVYFLVLAGLDESFSFLVIAVVYLVIAGLAALVGVRKLKQVRGPERTIETSKKIPPALKGQQRAPSLQSSGRAS